MDTKIPEINLPHRIVTFFIILIVVATIFHVARPRESMLHALKKTLHDAKMLEADIFSERISRVIREAQNEVHGKGLSESFRDINKTTLEKDALKPPCKGLRYWQEMPNTANFTMKDVENVNSDVNVGGAWKPSNCTSQHRVAIIIPYRDRYSHLIKLLARLVPILKQQNIFFKIYVTEQVGNHTFNKGVLMNAAFKEALKEEPWQCFVFHDVDLIPENVKNMYTCPWQPRHLSASIDEFGYTLPTMFNDLVGGVFAIQTEHFRKVNGYSNSYWGWGAEDDDMSMRLLKTGFRIDRPPYHVARYKIVKHMKAKHNKHRFVIYNKNRRLYKTDGLNSLNYTLIDTVKYPLYTNFLIDVGLPPNIWYFPKS